jgi:hypothetical protein
MPIVAEVLVQMFGIDRNYNHIQLMAVEVHYKQSHPLDLEMNVDQGLLFPLVGILFSAPPLPFTVPLTILFTFFRSDI